MVAGGLTDLRGTLGTFPFACRCRLGCSGFLAGVEWLGNGIPRLAARMLLDERGGSGLGPLLMRLAASTVLIVRRNSIPLVCVAAICAISVTCWVGPGTWLMRLASNSCRSTSAWLSKHHVRYHRNLHCPTQHPTSSQEH